MGRDNNITKGLLVGFFVGGTVGAVLALLYAPKAGKELRKDIKEKADEYYGEAEKYISDARSKAKDMINEGKKKGEKIISEAKVKSDELLKDAEKLFTDAKAKAGIAVSTGKDIVEGEAGRIKGAFQAGVEAYKETKTNNDRS